MRLSSLEMHMSCPLKKHIKDHIFQNPHFGVKVVHFGVEVVHFGVKVVIHYHYCKCHKSATIIISSKHGYQC